MQRRRPPSRPNALRRWSAEANLRRVIAVFQSRIAAEEAAEDVGGLRLPGATVALEDRSQSDDRPLEAAPAVERNERRRDAEVIHHVLRDTVLRSVLYAVGGAIVGALIGFVAFDPGARARIIAVVVGTVTGSVLGAMHGGVNAAMTESQKESGTLLVVETPDEPTARRAAEAVRRHHPSRVDLTRGRLAG